MGEKLETYGTRRKESRAYRVEYRGIFRVLIWPCTEPPDKNTPPRLDHYPKASYKLSYQNILIFFVLGIKKTMVDYWADHYVEDSQTAEEAIRLIKPGHRVFIGSSCGEPQHLVRALSAAADGYSDVEIVRLMFMESAPLTLVAQKTQDQNLNIRSFYLGSAKPRHLAENSRFLTPMNLSDIPRLFKAGQLPIQVALIQVSPPDDFGWLSLGVSVDITLAAAQSADVVIAQVNPRMPRVMGRSFLHVNDVDIFVEYDEPLLTVGDLPEMDDANTIGRMVAQLIDDGSTIQISPGTTTQAILLAMSDKNDLGIHTQFLTREIMNLVAQGVVTNRKKKIDVGKLVASSAIGDELLYDFIHDNPSIEFHPCDYVNNPAVIARHHKMVSMNVAMAMDLTGQVAADALPQNHFSGMSGMPDFIRGTTLAEGGKSILLLPSTSRKGTLSRIVPFLSDTAIVVPRGDVHYVASEYGVVNLNGKNLQERALAMISIAHPDFRDELFHEAKKMNLFSAGRSLKDSIRGVYPLRYEENLVIDRKNVMIRPTKPVDERRLQEHYYNLDKDDVISRFFHEKTRFKRSDVEGISQINYTHNLTLMGVTGDLGFGKVIAVGEYLLDDDYHLAEVAFSVIREWQGKGLGYILMKKLAEAALENGIEGLMAYTAQDNQAMVALFKTLPYQVTSKFEDDVLLLTCHFNQPKEDKS